MTTFETNAQTVLQELSAVLPRVANDQVTALVTAITAAKSVHVVGVGREGLAAKGFAMRIMHAGVDSHWVWDETTPAIGVDDLLVMTSGSGEIGHLHYVATKAKEAGAKLAVVTANSSGITAQLADLVLLVPAAAFHADGDVVPSIQPMGSLFEQALQLTFDLVLLEYVTAAGKNLSDLAQRHRNVE